MSDSIHKADNAEHQRLGRFPTRERFEGYYAAKFAREEKADPTRWMIRPVGRGLAHELRYIGEPEA